MNGWTWLAVAAWIWVGAGPARALDLGKIGKAVGQAAKDVGASDGADAGDQADQAYDASDAGNGDGTDGDAAGDNAQTLGEDGEPLGPSAAEALRTKSAALAPTLWAPVLTLPKSLEDDPQHQGYVEELLTRAPAKGVPAIPAYPGGVVLAASSPKRAAGGGLPQAVLASRDSLDKVEGWYRAQLKGWEWHAGLRAFHRPGASSTDLLMGHAVQVRINPWDSGSMNLNRYLPGGKAKIIVYYDPPAPAKPAAKPEKPKAGK